VEGTLSNDHLLASLSMPEASVQHQGIHLPISVSSDNLDDLNTLEASASFQLKNLSFSNQALGIQDYFVTQGISVERLFVCNPSISIEEEAKSIATLSL
jgi:hypothetical protein